MGHKLDIYVGSGFHATPLPEWFVMWFGYSLPWIEVIIGLFILLGLFTCFFLAAGALLILVLTVGSGLRQDWEITGLQLIYATVYAMLLAFAGANRYSIDNWAHDSDTLLVCSSWRRQAFTEDSHEIHVYGADYRRQKKYRPPNQTLPRRSSATW